GRRTGRGHRPGVAAGAREIFHIDLLAPALGQLLRHEARDHVGRTAGRERHDDAHRAARVSRILGVGCGCGRKRGREGKTANEPMHGILPGSPVFVPRCDEDLTMATGLTHYRQRRYRKTRPAIAALLISLNRKRDYPMPSRKFTRQDLREAAEKYKNWGK